MRAMNSWWTLARLAGVSVMFVAVLVGAGSVPALAQSPTISISPTSGPVGTVVTLHGNAGAGCSAGSFPTLEFEQGATGPVEFIVVPVASNGAWSATFVIPPFVGALATRGLFGGDVSRGTWEFQGPVCVGQVGPASTAPFEVTGTLALQPASRFVAMSATRDGKGYWLAQAGGGVLSYGDARFHGSLPSGIGGRSLVPAAPIERDRSHARWGRLLARRPRRWRLRVRQRAVLRIVAKCAHHAERGRRRYHPNTEWAWLLASRR